ncbi:flavodoxin [Arthrobacter celericrescens]|uniref:flavodoxin n=1 Tax=Arthrobacter celericrescens TaxID=2320851 RepID=UPI0019693F8D|nr:flavodoxin [Arthrobacter celericrescens]
MITKPAAISRRSALRGAAAGLGGVLLTAGATGCTAQGTDAMPSGDDAPSPGAAVPGQDGRRVLLACFSRAGENYHYGGRTKLDVGNTEILAGMVSALIPCDVHRIEAAEPYPESYDATVARNVREQDQDARPAILNPLAAVGRYDTVILASGIWNVRAPMIMATFAESYDFTGKTILPLTTHAMSGLGTTVRDYRQSCPGATIGEGLAVKGEEVRNAGPGVGSWLQRAGLLPARR